MAELVFFDPTFSLGRLDWSFSREQLLLIARLVQDSPALEYASCDHLLLSLRSKQTDETWPWVKLVRFVYLSHAELMMDF